MDFKANSLDDLPEISKNILDQLKSKIILFQGDLGAGKTTFIKYLVKELGSLEEVSSPTFSLVNEYEIPDGKVFHFDLYRIKSEDEALDFGFEEYIDSGNYCFIEWPETILGLLPEKFHSIKINSEGNTRTINFA